MLCSGCGLWKLLNFTEVEEIKKKTVDQSWEKTVELIETSTKPVRVFSCYTSSNLCQW